MTKPLPSEDEIRAMYARAQTGDLDAIQEYAALLDRCAAALLSKPTRPRRPLPIKFPSADEILRRQKEREKVA